MTLISRVLSWIARLPPADTYDVAVQRDIPISMPDGVVLLADHHYPRSGDNQPTLLVRSPYGRADVWGVFFGQLFAERG